MGKWAILQIRPVGLIMVRPIKKKQHWNPSLTSKPTLLHAVFLLIAMNLESGTQQNLRARLHLKGNGSSIEIHVYSNPAFVMWCWLPSNYDYLTMRSWQNFWLLVLIVSVLAGRHHCVQDFILLAHLLWKWVIGHMDLCFVPVGLFLHYSRYAGQKSLGCWCNLK